MARRELPHAILDDRSLMSHLLGLIAQGTLQALSRTCRRWSSDTYVLAPDASRTLASLTRWPSALRDDLGSAERERLLEQQLLAKRTRLVESIRMSCQDPHVVEGDGATPAADGAGSALVPESPADDAGGEWFRRSAFRDRRTTDEELLLALRRGARGDVRRLVLSSSRLTDAGVLRALEPHWASLVDLCLCNCGLSGGQLTGAVLAPVLRCPQGPRLRSLALVDIPGLPLAALAGACDLRMLAVRGRLTAPCVEAISACPGLETLKLSLEHKVVQDPFIRVFTACRRLRVVDIHGATDVSDQLLGCLMLHVPCLEDFCGSHAGDHLGCSRVLSPRMTEAFKAHYCGARRIFIDNLVGDSLL